MAKAKKENDKDFLDTLRSYFKMTDDIKRKIATEYTMFVNIDSDGMDAKILNKKLNKKAIEAVKGLAPVAVKEDGDIASSVRLCTLNYSKSAKTIVGTFAVSVMNKEKVYHYEDAIIDGCDCGKRTVFDAIDFVASNLVSVLRESIDREKKN